MFLLWGYIDFSVFEVSFFEEVIEEFFYVIVGVGEHIFAEAVGVGYCFKFGGRYTESFLKEVGGVFEAAIEFFNSIEAYNGFFFLIVDSKRGHLVKVGVGNNSEGGDARVHVVVVVYIGEFSLVSW